MADEPFEGRMGVTISCHVKGRTDAEIKVTEIGGQAVLAFETSLQAVHVFLSTEQALDLFCSLSDIVIPKGVDVPLPERVKRTPDGDLIIK